MGDLSRSVIDLAISTIKKTHHGVTIASVTDRFQADKEVCNIRVTFSIKNLAITTIIVIKSSTIKNSSVSDRFQAYIRVTINSKNLRITTIYHNLCILF